RTLTNLGEREFASDAGVFPVTDVAGEDQDVGADAARAVLEGAEAVLDWREGGSADHADDARFRDGAGEDAGDVAGVVEAEDDVGDVWWLSARAGGDDEDGSGIFRSYAFGGVLELEAVSEDEVEALGAVLSEVFFEVCGRSGLDM